MILYNFTKNAIMFKTSYIYQNINPFLRIVVNDQTHFKTLTANAARFLKGAWPFYDIAKQRFKVCSRIPFSKNLYHMETSQLICNTNQLHGFYMIQFFTERNFQTDINKQTKIKKKFLGI